MNLPVEPPEPRSSADTSSKRGVVNVPSYRTESNSTNIETHKPIHYISSPSIGKPLPPPPEHLSSGPTDLRGDNYPYVQLTTLNHDYLYPVIDDQQHYHHHKPSERLDRSNSQASLKKPDILVSQVSLFYKK